MVGMMLRSSSSSSSSSSATRIGASSKTKATVLPPTACRVQPRRALPQRRLLAFPPRASFDDGSSAASSSSNSSSSSAAAENNGSGSTGFLAPVASTSNGSSTAAPSLSDLSDLDNFDDDEDDTAEAAAAADYWSDLLNTPEPDMLGARARSASDAGVLRRKGHLKEQDALIDFMRSMHATHSAAEVMAKLDRWVEQHRADPARSRLRRLIPGIGAFFTPLDLTGALNEYDEFFALSRREFVPPNFAELRHVLNIAQVHASAAAGLRLVTFDADGTLYADGAHMQHDNEMIALIIRLLQLGVDVAIVTAAGYPGDAARFEQRVHGLLAAFAARKLPRSVTDRFHIMGGECNYLLRAVPPPGFRSSNSSSSAGTGASSSPSSSSSSFSAAFAAASSSSNGSVSSASSLPSAPYYYSEDEEGGSSENEASTSSHASSSFGRRRGASSSTSSRSDLDFFAASSSDDEGNDGNEEDSTAARRRRRRRRHLHHASITAEAASASSDANNNAAAAAAEEEEEEAGEEQAKRALSAAATARAVAASPSTQLPSHSPHSHRLAFVPDGEWKSPEMASWTHEEIERLLDAAQEALEEGAARLRLPVRVIRKERAVGVLPLAPTVYEVLEDLAISVQVELAGGKRWEGETDKSNRGRRRESDDENDGNNSNKGNSSSNSNSNSPLLPFCAFNGGGDVFVDVGNKSLGLDALKAYLGLSPSQVLHVGDRFTASGNDSATRDCCSILWVANPEETDFFIKLLIADLEDQQAAAGFGGASPSSPPSPPPSPSGLLG